MTIKQLYPAQRPALDLNFAVQKRLDPRVTFTRGSTATYVGNDGLIKYAVDNEPRFDHDPVTGESLGLLIEEERTNNFLYSEEFNDAFWSSGGLISGTVNIAANQTTSPDGTTTADLMTASSVTDEFCVGTAFRTTLSASTTYTFSVFVKPKELSRIALAYWDSGYGYTTLCFFNSSTGTFYYVRSGVTTSAQLLSNGWYRISATFTISSWGGNTLTIAIANPDNTTSSLVFDGTPYTGQGLYIWGAQLEEGAFPTSYIPTTSSTVTRAADVASLTNTGVYDTDSFTILNNPYGAAAGGSTLNIVGGGQTPVKRTTVYNQELSQSQINTLVKKDDEFWRWRILGSSFALPDFLTDGQVTVDWGDGTVETLTTSEHTFTDGGGYHDVGFRLDSGTYWRPFVNNNATHKDKVIALGPAPEGMVIRGGNAFNGCTNLKVFDATIDATADTSFSQAWYNCSSLTGFPLINTSGITDFYRGWAGCSSLTSFPLIDTSSGTTFQNAWLNCSSLTSFPLIDTSSGTNFSSTWSGCFNLTSFPLLDTSSGTNFQGAWYNCSSLTSFPLIDTSSGTNFYQAWRNCSSLTSFPLIDTSSGTSFYVAWLDCSSLTSFPLIDTSNGTTFYAAWNGCSSLTTFPAGFFDSWTGTPANNCFVVAWDNCSSLTATSVENILNSIDTSGQSAPASGVDITIDYDTGTGTPSVSTAVTNLKNRGWTISLNGVAQ
jgi:hypothetical protein